MKTLIAAKGQWSKIYSHFDVRIDPKKHIDCPMCDGKKKLRIADKYQNGDWICTCGNGDGFKLLQAITGKPFLDLAKQIDSIIGNEFNNQKNCSAEISKTEQAINKFKSAMPVYQSPAQEFFNKRHIFDLPKGGVKYIDREPFRDDTGAVIGYYPAIYSLASNHLGEPLKEHITYITKEGLKAPVPTVRKLRTVAGFDSECAVKLFQATDILGIGEGIESCLAAHQLYKIPTWAALNTAILKKFKAPKGVKTLYIFADNDKNGAGFAAAFECGHKNILSNNDVQKVVIRWREKHGDFNDVVTDGGYCLELILGE